jgi:hypothetical protein
MYLIILLPFETLLVIIWGMPPALPIPELAPRPAGVPDLLRGQILTLEQNLEYHTARCAALREQLQSLYYERALRSPENKSLAFSHAL